MNQAAQAVGLTNFCAKHIIWICYPNPDKFSLDAAHHWLPVPDQTCIPPNHYNAVAANRSQGGQSQTQCLFLLRTDSRFGGPRPNAYPPTTTPQWLLVDARVGSVPDRTLIPPILADARVGCVPDQMLIPLILADARVGNFPDPM